LIQRVGTDEHTVAITGSIFDSLYEFHRGATLLGREPA